MPIKVGLLGADGTDLLDKLDNHLGSEILQLHEREQLFTFQNIREKPVVSFLRDFSAPVRVESFQSREALSLLIRTDSNLFNSWDAANRLAGEAILELTKKLQDNQEPSIEKLYLEAVTGSLKGKIADPAHLALSLQLPSETTLAQEMKIVDPDALYNARQTVKRELAKRNKEQFTAIYHGNKDSGAYAITPEAIGRRSLKNTALAYLMSLDPLPEEIQNLCYEQYQQATNMTDTIAALANLVNLDNEIREDALEHFLYKMEQRPSGAR